MRQGIGRSAPVRCRCCRALQLKRSTVSSRPGTCRAQEQDVDLTRCSSWCTNTGLKEPTALRGGAAFSCITLCPHGRATHRRVQGQAAQQRQLARLSAAADGCRRLVLPITVAALGQAAGQCVYGGCAGGTMAGARPGQGDAHAAETGHECAYAYQAGLQGCRTDADAEACGAGGQQAQHRAVLGVRCCMQHQARHMHVPQLATQQRRDALSALPWPQRGEALRLQGTGMH